MHACIHSLNKHYNVPTLRQTGTVPGAVPGTEDTAVNRGTERPFRSGCHRTGRQGLGNPKECKTRFLSRRGEELGNISEGRKRDILPWCHLSSRHSAREAVTSRPFYRFENGGSGHGSKWLCHTAGKCKTRMW